MPPRPPRDIEVLTAELYFFLRQHSEPQHEARLIQFLNATGTRSELVPRIIERATRMKLICEIGQRKYTTDPNAAPRDKRLEMLEQILSALQSELVFLRQEIAVELASTRTEE
jgi:hypothetical protein